MSLSRRQFGRMAAGACASGTLTVARAQEASERFTLDIQLQASAQVNPDESGRPSPVRLRVYELLEASAFTEADHFGLMNNDKAALGGAVLARDEFILLPREVARIQRKSHPRTQLLAFAAGYRDLEGTWRLLHALPERTPPAWYQFSKSSPTVALTLRLEAQTLVLSRTR